MEKNGHIFKMYGIMVSILIACMFSMTGCKLSIFDVLAPDSTETGRVITLSFNGTAQDEGDNADKYGLVLQIPQNWEVLRAEFDAGFIPWDLDEDPEIASQYTAEPNYKIWAGSYTSSGSESRNVTAEAYILTGNFAGNFGDILDYKVKASVGAMRNGVWEADDPKNVLDFSSIDSYPYSQEMSVQKVEDTQAPDPIEGLNVDIRKSFDGSDDLLNISWYSYDEKAQGDVVGYRVYIEDEKFTDVSDMTPEITRGPGKKSCTFSNISNGQEYYIAVTAFDEVPHENMNVSPVSVTIPGDIASILPLLLDE